MSSLLSTLKYVHNDETGAEGAEKVLIIAALVLPLLAVLLFFKEKIGEWLKTQWESILNNTQADTNTNPF
jgi:Flp pilus assembly pilin Flp